MTSPLRVALRDHLTSAMRARDKHTVEVIRSVIAALENAEAVPPAAQGSPVAFSEHVAGAAVGVGASEASRRALSGDDERAVVAREIDELRASAATLGAAGRHEQRAELIRKAEILEGLLEG